MNETKNTPAAAGSPGASRSACIVVWDDQMGCCVPMGWDADCEGAICAHSGTVAVFPDRGAARRAIAISAKFAALCKAQGKPSNDDFLGDAKRNLHLLPLSPNASSSATPNPEGHHGA